LEEVKYNPKNSISLSSVNGFKKFKTDLDKAWENLLKIYVIEQEKINWDTLLEELKL
ncbi:MAG: hypothetical protein HY476_05580, partial [Nitrosarchaeum sp.]|nr:hypothetical protein [Nitrosarchaeum sp.]